MKTHALTLLALVCAVVLYFLGATLPAGGFLVAGTLAELVFWIRLARGDDDSP